MATSNVATTCFTCKQKTTTYSCPDCQNYFCADDLIKHRQELKSQFHQIQQQTNEFMQILNDQQKTLYHRQQLKSNIKWKFDGQTIAGGNGEGDQLNQLFLPHAIYVDHQQ